jgi:very-short-patch-repair endonuclease
MHAPKPIALSIRARSLRAASTDAERRIWRSLRSRQLMGCKLRRQHPIGPYIVDFICLERRLVIELDGSQHQEAVEHDAAQEALVRKRGFVVPRLWNNDVLRETRVALEKIRTVALLGRPSPPPSPTGVGEGGFRTQLS